jgi:hypothetical protein
MAFGLSRVEMNEWKLQVSRGEIAFLTHYWIDTRFPEMTTVTKVGCSDLNKLSEWCHFYGLNPHHIHKRSDYPHFDLIGKKQKKIMIQEQQWGQIERFHL